VHYYDGNTNQPSFQQLQTVTDNSNLQSVITGNPNLKPEFSHRGKVEYRQTDTHLGSSLYGRISIEQVNDKIVTSKNIADDEVKQENSYANVNGSRSEEHTSELQSRENSYAIHD